MIDLFVYVSSAHGRRMLRCRRSCLQRTAALCALVLFSGVVPAQPTNTTPSGPTGEPPQFVPPIAPSPTQQAQQSNALPCADASINQISGQVVRLEIGTNRAVSGVVLENGVAIEWSAETAADALKAAHVGNHVRAYGKCTNRTSFLAQRLVTEQIRQ